MCSGFHNALLQEETRYKDAVYHAPYEEIQAAGKTSLTDAPKFVEAHIKI